MYKQWIQGFYNEELYTKDDVKVFVRAGWITETDYKDITGDAFTAA